MNDSVCMVWLAMNLLISTVTSRAASAHRAARGATGCSSFCLEAGEGQQKDLDLLFGVSNNIVGKTLCAFGMPLRRLCSQR